MARYKRTDVSHKFDESSRLGYAIQGKRGGTPQVKDDLGSVSVFVDSPDGCKPSTANSITIDAFEGRGETYKRRKTCGITIREGGKEIFKGTFTELATRIGTPEKNYGVEPVDCDVLE